jgi:hypothetical protein
MGRRIDPLQWARPFALTMPVSDAADESSLIIACALAEHWRLFSFTIHNAQVDHMTVRSLHTRDIACRGFGAIKPEGVLSWDLSHWKQSEIIFIKII